MIRAIYAHRLSTLNNVSSRVYGWPNSLGLRYTHLELLPPRAVAPSRTCDIHAAGSSNTSHHLQQGITSTPPSNMTDVLHPPSVAHPFDGPSYHPSDTTSTPKHHDITAIESFQASRHLNFEMPEVVMMEDIGYAKDAGVSPVAVSKPFQLFSHAAVQHMRREIFDVRQNHPEHVYQSNIAPCQVRGYAPK